MVTTETKVKAKAVVYVCIANGKFSALTKAKVAKAMAIAIANANAKNARLVDFLFRKHQFQLIAVIRLLLKVGFDVKSFFRVLEDESLRERYNQLRSMVLSIYEGLKVLENIGTPQTTPIIAAYVGFSDFSKDTFITLARAFDAYSLEHLIEDSSS